MRAKGYALTCGAMVIGVGTYLLSSTSGTTAGLFPYTDVAVVAAGAEIYAESCASCHGDKLEGEPNWRTAKEDGRMPAPPHDRTGHTWHHPDQQLFMITKYGIAAVAPEGYESDMFGFGEQLSDAEIIAVLAYIKSTWPAPIQKRHDQINEASEG